MCAAARIFDAVRRKAAENNPDSNGQFDSIYVRRVTFSLKSIEYLQKLLITR